MMRVCRGVITWGVLLAIPLLAIYSFVPGLFGAAGAVQTDPMLQGHALWDAQPAKQAASPVRPEADAEVVLRDWQYTYYGPVSRFRR